MIQIERLLLPTDFSESARHAFSYGMSFARDRGAALYLLHVIEVMPVGHAGDLFPAAMTQFVEEVSGYARTEIASWAEEARAAGLTVHERIARGKPAAEILRVAAEERIDLVVIGTHGRGTLSHVLFGSTTERVARKAPCSVLVCRPGEGRPA
jgi:nucleotide-binding universal stress UspA family protein